jgi:hypothetical protein
VFFNEVLAGVVWGGVVKYFACLCTRLPAYQLCHKPIASEAYGNEDTGGAGAIDTHKRGQIFAVALLHKVLKPTIPDFSQSNNLRDFVI